MKYHFNGHFIEDQMPDGNDVENKYLLNVPTLFGTINYYGDMQKTTFLLDIMISGIVKAKKIK